MTKGFYVCKLIYAPGKNKIDKNIVPGDLKQKLVFSCAIFEYGEIYLIQYLAFQYQNMTKQMEYCTDVVF